MTSPYQGDDRRAPQPPPDLGWHLDRKVPLTLIAAMIAQVVIAVMFLADLKRDMELTKARVQTIEAQANADRGTLRDALQILRDQLKSMDQKLDRVIERGTK